MALKPLSELPKEPLNIKRALLSVSDKTGLLPLAQALHKAGIELISTGGTARHISEADIPVKDVSEITGYRECLDGRVKTLHPAVHGGILARTSHQPDVEELQELGIAPIQLVVVNLYPFRQTIAKPGVTEAEATEFIDIGGPTMIRAAAKNFAHVCILTNPAQYPAFVEQMAENGNIDFSLRKSLARDAFSHTAAYDTAIANYFNSFFEEDHPEQLNISLPLSQTLRYGENPHQAGAVYGNQSEYIDCFHGKQLSYNNFLDVDAALNLIADFENDGPSCAIFKHTVPCGVSTAASLHEAWTNAFATDTSSPFGGIVVVNTELDLATAKAIDEIFTEIIIAPSFTAEALELLQQKKNRRLVVHKKSLANNRERQVRSIFGGVLSQQPDTGSLRESDLKTVTRRAPSEQELRDLLFTWKVVKHVKSNGIVFGKNSRTLGIGTGQTSRVEASNIAVAKAKDEGLSLKGSVIASDAFFPFADGIEAAARNGITAAIQPGGSIRDDEVVAMADKHDIAMVFTGKRHFKH